MNPRHKRGIFYVVLDDEKIKKSVLSALILEGFETSEFKGDYLVCGESDPLRLTEENPTVCGVIVLYRNRDYISCEQHFTLSEKFGGKYVFLRCPYLLSDLYTAADSISADSEQTDTLRNEEFGVDSMVIDDLTVSYRGKKVRLTDREADLFKYLLSHRGETVSREDIRKNVWEKNGLIDTNVTDVYVSYLRRKLKPLFGDGVIISVRGKGYILSL